jgi:hypothetical protein
MATPTKAKSSNNFHISLFQSPTHRYGPGSPISGSCILHSTKDETVGSVTITFTGLVTAYLDRAVSNTMKGADWETSDFNASHQLFKYTKTLYEGRYTLRRDTPYEWPFSFEFPTLRDLPASGRYGQEYAEAKVKYVLEARKAGVDDPSLAGKSLLSTITRKGSVGGERMLSEIQLEFRPRVLSYAPLPPKPFSISHQLPLFQRRNSNLVFKLQNFVKKSEEATINYVFKMPLSTHLESGTPIPLKLRVEHLVGAEEAFPDALPSPAPIRLTSIFVAILCNTTITIPSSTAYVPEGTNTCTHAYPIVDKKKESLSIQIGEDIDLGVMYHLSAVHDLKPPFRSKLVTVKYDFKVKLGLECGGKKIKVGGMVENVDMRDERPSNGGSPLGGVLAPGPMGLEVVDEPEELPEYSR